MFSIVIPTYNHAHLLPRCIESIINQTYTDWELIIVNNASTDNTIQVIESYHHPKVSYINFNNDQGIAASRNVGIKAAKGDFVCFLDSDDWWKPNKLEVCSAYTATHDLIYHNLEVVSADGKALRKQLYSRQIPTDNFLADMFINGNPIKNSSVMLSKNIIEKIGYLDEDMGLMAVEDFDYWLRALQAGARPKYITDCLGYYWVGSNTSSKLVQIQRNQHLFDKYKGQLQPSELRLAEKMLHYQQGRVYQSNKMFGKALTHYLKSLSLRSDKFRFALIGIVTSIFRVKI